MDNLKHRNLRYFHQQQQQPQLSVIRLPIKMQGFRLIRPYYRREIINNNNIPDAGKRRMQADKTL